MPTKQQHTFGVDDRRACPECGGEMTLIRRTPYTEPGGEFEMANFRVPHVSKYDRA